MASGRMILTEGDGALVPLPPVGKGSISSADIAPFDEDSPTRPGLHFPPGRDLVADGGSISGGEHLWFERSWWTAAGIMLLLWSFRLLGSVSSFPLLAVAVLVTGAWGVVTLLAAWRPGLVRAHADRSSWWAWLTLVVMIAALGIWSLIQVYQAPGYGTDEMAFDQYAAQLLAHGVNPYLHSMAPAFPRFHVQPNGYTFHLNGTPVTALSYPALSFLVYVPFLLVGLSSQIAVGLNVVAWAVAIAVTFAVLPRPMRPMALVIGSLSVYIGYAVGGVTVALFVPLLVIAALRWDRFGAERGWRSWTGPVCLGLAMCINQAPWFVLPFVLVGIAAGVRPTHGWQTALRTAGRYLGIVCVAFLIPNLAFIIWDPGAWLRGILTPIASQTVPAGQGLIALSLYMHLGGGSLFAYTALSGIVMLVLLAIYAVTYPRMRPMAFLLPAVVFLFTTRSYGSYLVGLIPAALVAAVSVRDSAGGRPWRHWPWVAAGGAAIAGVAAAVALATPGPLAVSILGVNTTGQLATVDQVTVRVHNGGSTPMRPYFTLNSGDALTSFWLSTGGPAVLRPGQGATYTLLSPNFFAQPDITGGFQVVAFTSSPASMSHSGPYLPTTDHLAFVPDAIGRVVPVGQAITVKAEVLDRLDRPVHHSGIPVYMGQIIYAQRGLQYGQAIINSSQPGQTPVSTLTNAQGVATFTIRGTQATSDPVYFEANLVNDRRFYPFGYSQILPIRFGGSS